MEPAAVALPATSPAPPSPAGAGWIVGRWFDLVWFFGGAALALLVFGLSVGAGISIALLYWGWTLLIDGPHIGASYTRTYLDREEWRARRGFFVWSAALSLALGPLALGVGLLADSPGPWALYLGAMGLWSYHHVVRQHWGFVALYRAKAGERVDLQLDRWCLYVGAWAPYAHLLLVHPWARRMLELPSEPGPAARAGALACLLAWGAALGAFALRNLTRTAPAARIKVAYLLLTLLTYGVTYFWIARLEPLWPEPASAEQAFMLISLLVALLHGPQYVALVWFHNRRRYGGGGPELGPARALNASLGRYLGALLVFSALIYCLLAAWSGVFPLWRLFPAGAAWGPVTAEQVGLSLWWGLAMHHYVLDQRIWRLRGDEALRRNLGL